MSEVKIDAWKSLFFAPEDLVLENHTKRIKPKNTAEQNPHMDYLIKSAFEAHLLNKPEAIDISSIKFEEPASIRFFKQRDVDNLFITKYYKYPSIDELYESDLSFKREIRADKILSEIKGYLTSSNGIVVLLGNVGEGKSAFLSKIASELKRKNSKMEYFPIIINVESFDKVFELPNQNEAYENFWGGVCGFVADYLDDHSSNIAFSTGIFAGNDDNKLDIISLKEYSAALRILDRSKSVFSSLKRVAEYLDEHRIRLILIFDNLDTFSYEHERYMLFQKGFDKLKSKINIVQKIFSDVSSKLIGSEISFIFTARPYVYRHVFQREVHHTSNGKIDAIFRLKEIDPGVPIVSRMNLLEALTEKLKQNPDSDEKTINTKIEIEGNFLPQLNRLLQLNQEVKNKNFIKKSYNLANQGFRSLVAFYAHMDYDQKLFPRYFRHDMLYLYLLSMRALYSQLLPEGEQKKQISYFPNIFLINCDNYYNTSDPNVNRPHRLTYWLKYLILAIVSCERINLKNIIEILSDYEEHAVRLCLGSMATVNEYNLLNLDFQANIDDLPKLENFTYATCTKRGKYLFDDFFCLGFECLQLYFDDWLMPRPRSELFAPEFQELVELLQPDISNPTYSYEYLLNANTFEYDESSLKMIRNKAKQSLLLLSILRAAQKYEETVYRNSWTKVKDLAERYKIKFISNDAYPTLQTKIIEQAYQAMHKDTLFKADMEYYKSILNENSIAFDDFFNKVKRVTPEKPNATNIKII